MSTSFAYFDHNVLNYMVRGGESVVRKSYQKDNLVPVYSDENIDEINRSTQRREEFMRLLERMKARHINIPLDENFNSLKFAIVTEKNPRVRSDELAEAREGYESSQSGLEFLEKLHGGQTGTSFLELMNSQLDEIKCDMENALAELGPDSSESNYAREMFSEILEKIPDVRKEVKIGTKDFDERTVQGSLVRQAEQAIGVGPVQLNNIKMPGVVEKVWDLVGPAYGAPEKTLRDYLQIPLQPAADTGNAVSEYVQRVTAVYNWLNTVGFCRDEDLDISRKMKASFGDITHVGYGAYCTRFYCDDRRMFRKAEATFEFLGIRTELVAIRQNFKSKVEA